MFWVYAISEVVQFLVYWLLDLVQELVYGVFRCRPRKEIKNENILITGSGQGLGLLVTELLAKDGNTLHCVDINEKCNEQMKEDLKDRDCTIYTYKCDVGELENITILKKQIKLNVPDRHISYLFNIAGIVIGKPFHEETEQEMLKVIKVNVLGVIFLQKMVFKEMCENYGHIINISSLAGMVGSPLLVDYCASKYAVKGLSDAMTCELTFLKQDNVHVTSVQPHVTRTGMFNNTESKWPLVFPLLEPDWVAEQIVIATKENRQQVHLPKRLNVFFFLEHLMSARVYKRYSLFYGSDLMKTFKKIRAD